MIALHGRTQNGNNGCYEPDHNLPSGPQKLRPLPTLVAYFQPLFHAAISQFTATRWFWDGQTNLYQGQTWRGVVVHGQPLSASFGHCLPLAGHSQPWPAMAGHGGSWPAFVILCSWTAFVSMCLTNNFDKQFPCGTKQPCRRKQLSLGVVRIAYASYVLMRAQGVFSFAIALGHTLRFFPRSGVPP